MSEITTEEKVAIWQELIKKDEVAIETLYEKLGLDYKAELERRNGEIQTRKKMAYQLQTPYQGEGNGN